MALSLSARLGLTRWGAGTDPLRRSQLDDDHRKLDELVAMAQQGTAANRPAAGVERRYYYATDTRILSLDTGAAWLNVAEWDAGGLILVRRSLPGNKPGADGPSTYPLGYASHNISLDSGAAAAGYPGGESTYGQVLTHRDNAGRAYQWFVEASGTGRSWTRTQATADTWTPWREALTRAGDGTVNGGVAATLFGGAVRAFGSLTSRQDNPLLRLHNAADTLQGIVAAAAGSGSYTATARAGDVVVRSEAAGSSIVLASGNAGTGNTRVRENSLRVGIHGGNTNEGTDLLLDSLWT